MKDLTGRMARTSLGSSGGGGAGNSPATGGRRSAATPTSSSSSSSSGTSAARSSYSGHLIRRGQHERRRIPPSTPQSRLDFVDSELSLEGDELMKQLSMVRRKKDFEHVERVNGRVVNIVQGLELHTGVFNPSEQKKIVECIHHYQEKGRQHRLRDRTYSEPKKWMRGKGRVTIQFGCIYNYAVDKDGNPPGIIRNEEVDPIPPLLKSMIRRMVEWRVLPTTCVPDSCIVNIYDKDDCIPPHIDHHDFIRPFCTVSFLAECSIVFGTELKVAGPGDFSGPVAIPLPVGSVLVLNGNGAEVAKHCVPAVPCKRISITFRKMDRNKVPFGYAPDSELQNLRPLTKSSPPRPLPSPAQPAHDDSERPHPEARNAASPAGDKESVSQSANGRGSATPTAGGGQTFSKPVAAAGAIPFTLGDFPPLGAGMAKQKRSLRQ